MRKEIELRADEGRKRVKMRRKKVETKIKGDLRRKQVNMGECREDLGNRKSKK